MEEEKSIPELKHELKYEERKYQIEWLKNQGLKGQFEESNNHLAVIDNEIRKIKNKILMASN